jgi:hypothetical protein
VIARETDRFLDGIAERMAEHPDDPVTGLSTATDYVLRMGAENALLRAILAGGNGPDGDLLALLAARSEPVLQRTLTTTLAHARHHYTNLELPEGKLASVIEVFVRLTLSHLLQPTSPIQHAVEQVHDIVAHCLHSSTGKPRPVNA